MSVCLGSFLRNEEEEDFANPIDLANAGTRMRASNTKILTTKSEKEIQEHHEKGRLEQKRNKVTKYEKEEHLAMTVANHTKKMDFSQ